MIGDIGTTGKGTPKTRVQGLGTYSLGTHDTSVSARLGAKGVFIHIQAHIDLVANHPLGELSPAQRWMSLVGQGDGGREE